MTRASKQDLEEKIRSALEKDPMLVSVGQKILAARKARALTQADLGARAGMQFDTILHSEKGVQNLTLKTLYKIAVALDVSLRDLMPDAADDNALSTQAKAAIVEDLDNILRALTEIAQSITAIKDKFSNKAEDRDAEEAAT